MVINNIEDLIEAAWINCMRVSNLHTLGMHNIRQSGDELLPSFYIKLFNKNFDDLLKAEDFFAPINKQRNRDRFIDILNGMGRFTLNDIVINGALSIKTINATEYRYEDS